MSLYTPRDFSAFLSSAGHTFFLPPEDHSATFFLPAACSIAFPSPYWGRFQICIPHFLLHRVHIMITQSFIPSVMPEAWPPLSSSVRAYVHLNHLLTVPNSFFLPEREANHYISQCFRTKKGMVVCWGWKVIINSRETLTGLGSTDIKRQWSWWCNYSSTFPVIIKMNKILPKDAWKNSLLRLTSASRVTIPGTCKEMPFKAKCHFNHSTEEKIIKCKNISRFILLLIQV